jgi:hypothetical protein
MKLLNFRRDVPPVPPQATLRPRAGADWPPPEGSEQDRRGAEGDFPVQNGKATFTLMATATFSGRVLPAHDGVIDRHHVCVTATEATPVDGPRSRPLGALHAHAFRCSRGEVVVNLNAGPVDGSRTVAGWPPWCRFTPIRTTNALRAEG